MLDEGPRSIHYRRDTLALGSRSFHREHFRQSLHRLGKTICLLHHLPGLVNKINRMAGHWPRKSFASSAEKSGTTCLSRAKAVAAPAYEPPTGKLVAATARTSGRRPAAARASAVSPTSVSSSIGLFASSAGLPRAAVLTTCRAISLLGTKSTILVKPREPSRAHRRAHQKASGNESLPGADLP